MKEDHRRLYRQHLQLRKDPGGGELPYETDGDALRLA